MAWALVLATGETGADFPAIAKSIEEAAVAGCTGVAAGDLMPKAGLQEADTAAGGTLFSARSLQFCGGCLLVREEEEEGKSWCWTTVPAIKNCMGESQEWLLKPASASSGKLLSCSALGSACWKLPLSTVGSLWASLPHPPCLKAFMNMYFEAQPQLQ